MPSLLHLLLGVIWIVFFYHAGQIKQDDFHGILCWATPVFIIYAYIISRQNVSLIWWMTMALMVRLISVFHFPLLSDDIYRFYFDGNMIWQGINPYGLIPSEHPGLVNKIQEPFLLNKMNSPDYYTVYPPLAQYTFALAAWTGSLIKAKITMALMMTIMEGISMLYLYRLLKKILWPPAALLWYYLNPLVIIEGMGNVHFDVFVAASLVLMLYFLFEKSYLKAGIWWAVGIGFKLTPILLFPLLFKFFNPGPRKTFLIAAGVTLTFLFLPFMITPGFFTVLKSINLYFQTFEFNGGVYYVLRELGQLLSGYNLIFYIGPILALTTIALIVTFSKRIEKGNVIQFSLLASLSWLIYLCLSTTVHPWYLIPVLIMTIFTRWVLVTTWSFLILFSYIHYDPDYYVYEPLIICLEYGIILLLFFFQKNYFKRKLV